MWLNAPLVNGLDGHMSRISTISLADIILPSENLYCWHAKKEPNSLLYKSYSWAVSGRVSVLMQPLLNPWPCLFYTAACPDPGHVCSIAACASPGRVCSLAVCASPGRVCSITACASPGRVCSIAACAVPGRVCSNAACAVPGRVCSIAVCAVPGH